MMLSAINSDSKWSQDWYSAITFNSYNIQFSWHGEHFF
jgi:hypothetical protein